MSFDLRKVFVILLFAFTHAAFGMTVGGQLVVDSTWRPTLYLSIINDFKDLNTASYHFLIAEIPVDSNGNFNVKINGLPTEDHLYRLHVCKKGDPISTIMIGGQDENFMYFIGNASSSIIITGSPAIPIFDQVQLNGHPANPSLAMMFDWKRKLYSAPRIGASERKELDQNEMKNRFLNLVDTSSFSLVRLMAMHFLDDLGITLPLNVYRQQTEMLSISDTSPYAQQLREKYAFLDYQEKAQNKGGLSFSTGFIVGLLTLLFISAFYYFNHKNARDASVLTEQKGFDTQLLSSQERRVLELLKEKLSNKEIASELNIEVTTVKSHVYRIFSKLGIKSRREIWS
jgi:DNA-binding CsgD family transcriptional regulator